MFILWYLFNFCEALLHPQNFSSQNPSFSGNFTIFHCEQVGQISWKCSYNGKCVKRFENFRNWTKQNSFEGFCFVRSVSISFHFWKKYISGFQSRFKFKNISVWCFFSKLIFFIKKQHKNVNTCLFFNFARCFFFKIVSL